MSLAALLAVAAPLPAATDTRNPTPTAADALSAAVLAPMSPELQNGPPPGLPPDHSNGNPRGGVSGAPEPGFLALMAVAIGVLSLGWWNVRRRRLATG